MDDVGVQDRAVLLVPGDGVLDEEPGLVRVIEARATIAALDAGAEVLHQVGAVGVEMVLKRLERRRGAAAVVFDQRGHHPAHARELAPGAVVNILPANEDLVFAGQGPVFLAIAHGGLVAAMVKVIIRRVDEDPPLAAAVEELGHLLPLDPEGIIAALVIFVVGRLARITVVGTIGLDDVLSDELHELEQPLEVAIHELGPEAKAGRVNILLRVVLRPLGSGGTEQNVAADPDALAVGVVEIRLDPLPILAVGAVHVEAAPKGQDDHLEAGFGALVHRAANGLGIGVAQVHEDRVLLGPGSDGAEHLAARQALALGIVVIVQNLVGSEGGELLAKFQGFGEPLRILAQQEVAGAPGAGILAGIHLLPGIVQSAVGEVAQVFDGFPPLGVGGVKRVLFPARGRHLVERVVAFHPDARGLVVGDGKDLGGQAVELDLVRSGVPDHDLFAQQRDSIVHLVVNGRPEGPRVRGTGNGG